MNFNREFYIGWKERMPENQKRFLKKILLPFLALLPVLAFAFVWFQQPFNQHQFEFGNVKDFRGLYHAQPVPVLVVSEDAVPEGYSNHMLLVGYGKFGANGILQKMEEEKGSLDGKFLTLTGTLIYGDGKVLLELTDEEKSLIAVTDEQMDGPEIILPAKTVSLKGEILDPKCYFGVMKPGRGKIHRSCAIRCISGGIPPVLRTAVGDEEGIYEYYILLGPDGEAINQEVLPHVAKPIHVSGSTSRQHGWDILYVDPDLGLKPVD